MHGRDAQRELAANNCYISTCRSPKATPADSNTSILLAGTLSAQLKGDVAKGLLGKTARWSLDSKLDTQMKQPR